MWPQQTSRDPLNITQGLSIYYVTPQGGGGVGGCVTLILHVYSIELCYEGGGGVKNCRFWCYVIYGQPLIQFQLSECLWAVAKRYIRVEANVSLLKVGDGC